MKSGSCDFRWRLSDLGGFGLGRAGRFDPFGRLMALPLPLEAADAQPMEIAPAVGCWADRKAQVGSRKAPPEDIQHQT